MGNLNKKLPCVMVIGAGAIGSRHFQSLANLDYPLRLILSDPNKENLKIGKERFESQQGGKSLHEVSYVSDGSYPVKEVDIAIVATTSRERLGVIQSLVGQAQVRYLLLEKILFGKVEDYHLCTQLLQGQGTAAWVNCPMRILPYYHHLKEKFHGQPILYEVNGGQYNLVTNLIHYIDHMAFLTGASHYEADFRLLDPKPFESRRKGYLEANGTFQVRFENGSLGSFTCFGAKASPVLISICSPDTKFVAREWQSKGSIAEARNDWRWDEVEVPDFPQSQLTSKVVDEILKRGTSTLPSYAESSRLHLPLVEALAAYLKQTGIKSDFFPFT